MARISSTAAWAFALLALGAGILPAAAQASHVSPELIWSDEFAGAAGTQPDATKWAHDTGYGWGNGAELQAYTDRPQNVSLDGRGNLAITARAETYTGPGWGTASYTSGRVNTRGRFSSTYGHLEARIKVPAGQGLWPAFWLLGDDIFTTGWPGCGEIDMMEVLGHEPDVLYQSIHGPQPQADDGEYGITQAVDFAQPLSSDFHVYGVEWGPGWISLIADGQVRRTFTPADLPATAQWVFDHPHHLVLSLAVGGEWPGAPDSTTPFPATMLIDWVRVWKGGSHPPATTPRPSTAKLTGSSRLLVKGREVHPRIACDGETGCKGKALLSARTRGGRGTVTLGRALYSLKAGASERTSIRIRPRGRKLLEKRRGRAWAKILLATADGKSDSRVVRLRSRSHR